MVGSGTVTSTNHLCGIQEQTARYIHMSDLDLCEVYSLLF